MGEILWTSMSVRGNIEIQFHRATTVCKNITKVVSEEREIMQEDTWSSMYLTKLPVTVACKSLDQPVAKALIVGGWGN
ncbi:uncharacterized protein EAE98_002892 [Botrytis deweyae]|uniref:Peptidase S1 domain-containing protein n=1 Tax=Botrytis deweyae TaxID=2478750 RepID=A0ABQ7IV04_9HELO|nr:uncharacterized protein EAE98_002892 [Botrytis deweyae]KAF7934847.1 hypothetical protein EAE98_002892 [Botrytis deweyae]